MNYFEQFHLFLLTQSQREASARANNILHLPPTEQDKLKRSSNCLPKNKFTSTLTEWGRHSQSEKYWSCRNILRCPQSDTSTVTMKNTGLTEIYFTAYRVKRATVKLKSSASRGPAIYTLTGHKREEVVQECYPPKHSRMGTTGSARFHDLTQQGYGKWRTLSKVFAQALAHWDSYTNVIIEKKIVKSRQD